MFLVDTDVWHNFFCSDDSSFIICVFGWSRFLSSVSLLFLFLVAMSGIAASPIFPLGRSSVYPMVPKWPKIYNKDLCFLSYTFILSYQSSLVCSNIQPMVLEWMKSLSFLFHIIENNISWNSLYQDDSWMVPRKYNFKEEELIISLCYLTHFIFSHWEVLVFTQGSWSDDTIYRLMKDL